MVSRRCRTGWLVAAAVAVLVTAGCKSDSGSVASPGSTSTTDASATAPSTTLATVSTTTTSTADVSVQVAFEAASRAFIDAAAVPDPDAPQVAATHTGPMLEQRHGVLLALKAD